MVERFLALYQSQKVMYTASSTFFTLNTGDKLFHQKMKYSHYRPHILEAAVLVFVLLLLLDTILIKPVVTLMNDSIFTASMINKLYHKRKVDINAATGVNRIANIKGINPNKSHNDIVHASMS